MSSVYTSAEPLISFLHDDDIEIKLEALELINKHAHEWWSQLAPEVKYIEELSQQYEAMEKTASLIASKLYYHLNQFDKALSCALKSRYLTEQLLNSAPTTTTTTSSSSSSTEMVDSTQEKEDVNAEFEQAMIARSIESYIAYQRQLYLYESHIKSKQGLSDGDDGEDDDFAITTKNTTTPTTASLSIPSLPTQPQPIDDRIPALLQLLIERSIILNEHTSALGLAIDTLRLDWIRYILVTVSAKDAAFLMKETFSIAIDIVDIHPFRCELLRTLVDLYQTAPTDLANAAGSLTPIVPSTPSSSTSMDIDSNITTTTDDDDLSLRPSNSTKLHVVSDILALCQCLLALNDSEQTANILSQLIESTNVNDHLLAYQVAYDLTQNQQIAFTSKVASLLIGQEATPTTNALTSTINKQFTAKITAPSTTQTNTLLNSTKATTGTGFGGFGLSKNTTTGGNKAASTTDGSSSLPTVEPSDLETLQLQSISSSMSTEYDDETPQQHAKSNLYRILTGVAPIMLQNHFLYKNAQLHEDWFKNLSQHPDFAGDGTVASQLFTGYSIAQSGTHRDQFVRSSWGVFDKLTEWSQFTAKASIGNIYRGQYDAIKTILHPFLPTPAAMSTRKLPSNELGNFAQGGSLYAIGLAACGVTNNHLPYLLEVLDKSMKAADEPLQSGAALAIGLCGVGSGDLTIFEVLREILWGEQPIAGQSAGIAIGLLFIGLYADPDVQGLIKELLATACNNPHHNIQFGQGLGLALMYFNAQQSAESIVQYLRYGSNTSQYTRWLSCWIDAMAYCGTGNIEVIQRLLSLGIADPDNDVKRTAILALSFVLLNEPDHCLEIIEPLATSYNEHIRYAVAVAIGIVTSSSGITPDTYSNTVSHGISILQPLLKDKSDIVRQGALIGYSMSLQQTASKNQYHQCIEQIEECFKRSQQARVSLPNRIGGALASGILHAGGMNSNIRLIAPIGNQKRTIAIAGMMLFVNYWNWFPLANMFALTLSPTCLIGTYFAQTPTTPGTSTTTPQSNIRITPNLKFVIKRPKVAFAYPKRQSDELQQAVKKAVVNTLSAAKKKGGNKDSANLSFNSLNRTPSLQQTPSLRNFASDLLRTNSSINKNNNSSDMNDGKKDDKKTDDKKADDKKEDAATTTTTTLSPAQLAKLSAFNSAGLISGVPISTAMGDGDDKKDLPKRPTSSSSDKTTLSQTLSQIELKQKQKESKIPVAILPNCSRLLPRHIPDVFCPKNQQYQPIKKRLFGILVVKKMFEDPIKEVTLEEAMIEANAAASSNPNNQPINGEKKDGDDESIVSPPTITPGDDISQQEPAIPAPFKMSDE